MDFAAIRALRKEKGCHPLAAFGKEGAAVRKGKRGQEREKEGKGEGKGVR